MEWYSKDALSPRFDSEGEAAREMIQWLYEHGGQVAVSIGETGKI
jgi:hypothetical protein